MDWHLDMVTLFPVCLTSVMLLCPVETAGAASLWICPAHGGQWAWTDQVNLPMASKILKYGTYCYQKWNSTTYHSKANKEAKLLEGKFAFFWRPANGLAGGWARVQTQVAAYVMATVW